MEAEDKRKQEPEADLVQISIQDTHIEPDAESLSLMVQEHKEMMNKVAEMQGNSPKSLVINPAKYEAIVKHLQHPERKVEPHFKHWVKTRKFQLVDLPDQGLTQVLVIPKTRRDKWDYKSPFLRVVHSGHLSDLVHKVHAEELKHSGYKRVLDYLQRRYFGVTRIFTQEFCRTCPLCKLKPSQPTCHPSQRLLTESRHQPRVERHGYFQDTAHIDLIDMRHSPDGEYRFIGHFMDEYSQFHVLFPMKRKAAPELSRLLEERVLGYFGPPKVLHSSDNIEIINRLVTTTFERWSDDVNFVKKHSRNSRSNTFLEKGRRMIEERLTDIKESEGITGTHYPWASWLPRIMFMLNSECQDSARDSPYYSVYGCSSPIILFSEDRTQGRDESYLKSRFDQDMDVRERGEGAWFSESVRGTASDLENVDDPASIEESAPHYTIAFHNQERDHNYITTIKKFKSEVQDYNDDE